LKCRSALPAATEATVGENVSSAVQVTHSEEAEDKPERKAPDSQYAPIQVGTSTSAEPVALEQFLLSQDLVSESGSLADEDSGSEADHDSSFSSTPESFHSVDLPSFRRVSSSHISSTETHDAAIIPGSSVATSVAELSAKHGSVAVSPERKLSSGIDSTRCAPKEAEDNASPPELKMPKYIVREDPPKKPSLGIPSGNNLAVTSTMSPVTDFQHMSTEFRRRAQATRRRDVSPMPPSSTIYQPPPNDQASSLLTKALSLVLVPPIHLFIILLHVAARIVISPALNSALGDSNSGSQSPNKDLVPEDDFSFPLEREASSEYEDAEASRKLDPWDLD
jgi:hypothetical protein